MILFSISSFAQSVSTTCSWDNAAFRIKPNVDSTCIARVPINSPIIVIAKANSEYFKIVYKSDTGFMKRTSIIHEFKDRNGLISDDIKLFEKIPDENPIPKTVTYYSDGTMKGARSLYGPEDTKSQFQSGEYDAITLIWHCANGKYRSITYVFDGIYKKNSEYVSECLK